jgi:SAM-dependent methyltransferase
VAITPAAWYDGFYGAKDYAAEAAAVMQLVDRLVPHAATLLDVACGTGRHLEHFATRFRCEGSDLDETMLAAARRRLPDVRFTPGDLVTLDLGRTFDVVTCLFSSIGYCRTVDRLGAAVAALARHVNPGGVLIVEPWFTPERWDEFGRVLVNVVEESDTKAVRVIATSRVADVAVLRIHYVEARPGDIRHEDRREEFGLFTREQYVDAVAAAGMAPGWDDEGLTGRGLVTGVRSPAGG